MDNVTPTAPAGATPLPPAVQLALELPDADAAPRRETTLLEVPAHVANQRRALAKQRAPRPSLRLVGDEGEGCEALAPRLRDAENVDAATLLPPEEVLARIEDAYAVVGLSAVQTALLVLIAFRDGRRGRGCRMTMANMMAACGIGDRKTLRRNLAALVAMGDLRDAAGNIVGRVTRFKRSRTSIVSYYWRQPTEARGQSDPSQPTGGEAARGQSDPSEGAAARGHITPSLGVISPLASEQEPQQGRSPPNPPASRTTAAPAAADVVGGGGGDCTDGNEDGFAGHPDQRAACAAAGVNASKLPDAAFDDARFIAFCRWLVGKDGSPGMAAKGNAPAVAKAWETWKQNHDADAEPRELNHWRPVAETYACAKCGVPTSANQRWCNGCILEHRREHRRE